MPRRARGVGVAVALTLCLTAAAPASARYLDSIGIPGLRVMGGAIWHVEPGRTVVGSLDIVPQLTFIALDDAWRGSLLVGYGFEGGGDTHLLEVGGELGLMPSISLGFDVGLRGLVGSSDGELGGGLRAVLGFEVLLGLVRVEGAYQLLGSSRGVEHDLRVSAGVDLLRLIFVLAL